jgi:hypothetical protein
MIVIISLAAILCQLNPCYITDLNFFTLFVRIPTIVFFRFSIQDAGLFKQPQTPVQTEHALGYTIISITAVVAAVGANRNYKIKIMLLQILL